MKKFKQVVNDILFSIALILLNIAGTLIGVLIARIIGLL